MNCSRCKLPVMMQTVKSQGANYGKSYLKCEQCGHFAWVGDSTLLSTHNLDRSALFSATPHSSLGLPSYSNSNKVIVKMQLHLIESNPFRAWIWNIHSKHEALELFYRKIPVSMKRYEHSIRMWIIDINYYDELINSLTSKEYCFVDLIQLPKFLILGLKRHAASMKEVQFSEGVKLDIRDEFLDRLKSFQVAGVKFVIQHCGRALIGDEMGTGKTVQAIACIEHYKQHLPALILLPPTLLSQWKREITKFCEGFLSDSDVCIVRKSSDKIYGQVCLVPYSILQTMSEQKKIKPEQFGIVVCDESHHLKNKDAKRTGVAVPFLKRAAVALCLSGTPATNRPVELFCQLQGLLPKVFTDYDQFVKRYCDAKQANYLKGALDVRGSSNPQELKLLLEGLVMIRRMKTDVLDELPEKCREMLSIQPDPCYNAELKRLEKEAERLNNLLKDPRNDHATNKKIKSDQQINMTMQYNACGLAKIPGVIKYITELIKEAKDFQDSADAIEASSKDSQDKINTDDEGDVLEPRETVAIIDNNLSIDDDNQEEIWPDCNENDFRESPKRKRLTTKSRNKSSVMPGYSDVTVLDDTDDDDILFVDKSMLKPSSSMTSKSSRRSSTKPHKIITRKMKQILNVDETCQIDDVSRKSDYEDASLAWKNLLTGKNSADMRTLSKKHSKKQKRCLDHKIIVFAHHKAVMNALEDCFNDLKVSLVRVDGDVSTTRKDTLIKQFQEDDITEVALLSITSCGTGLNLTRANIAVFAELSWSLGSVLQAEDRIHRFHTVIFRMGQESASVRVIYLVGKGTFDQVMWSTMGKKHNVIGATVGNSEKRGCGLNARSAQLLDRFMTLTDIQTNFAELSLESLDTEFPIDNERVSTDVRDSKPLRWVDSKIEQFFGRGGDEITTSEAINEYASTATNISSSIIPGLNMQTEWYKSSINIEIPSNVNYQPYFDMRSIRQNQSSTASEFSYSPPSGMEFIMPKNDAIDTSLSNRNQNDKTPSVQSSINLHKIGHTANLGGLSPDTKAKIERNKRMAIERRLKLTSGQRPQMGLNLVIPEDNSFNFLTAKGTVIGVSSDAVDVAASHLNLVVSAEQRASLANIKKATTRSID